MEPDEIIERWKDESYHGVFPAGYATDWLQDHPEDKAEVDRLMEEGLSYEWAFHNAIENIPGPSEWEVVHFAPSGEGYSLDITDESGKTHHVDLPVSGEWVSDSFYADLMFSTQDYDYDRDTEYAED